MKKKLLPIAIFLLIAPALHAETVNLEDDIGCDARGVQQTRVRLTRIIMTADNEQAKDQATREIIALTKERCTPLTGIFTVQEKVQGLLRVNTKAGTELWLIE